MYALHGDTPRPPLAPTARPPTDRRERELIVSDVIMSDTRHHQSLRSVRVCVCERCALCTTGISHDGSRGGSPWWRFAVKLTKESHPKLTVAVHAMRKGCGTTENVRRCAGTQTIAGLK